MRSDIRLLYRDTMRHTGLCRQEHHLVPPHLGPSLFGHSGSVETAVEIPYARKSGCAAAAFYLRFSTYAAAEKNLHLHKSRALTFTGLQLGWLTSTVERVSQNKEWLIRSRLGDQVQRSNSRHARTRKNRQALRGAGWGQGLRKQ